MNVKMLKVFGTGLPMAEVALAADAAARTWKCKRFSLPIADAVYGHGFEILLFDDRAQEVADTDGDYYCDDLSDDMR